jgi:hypothetical protein
MNRKTTLDVITDGDQALRNIISKRAFFGRLLSAPITFGPRGLSRFVGRDAELARLRRAQELARAGYGQVVAIAGEAGVGKSRLLYEFTHSSRMRGWLVLESAAVSYGKATSYLPVNDLLKSYFEIRGRDDLAECREKITDKLRRRCTARWA